MTPKEAFLIGFLARCAEEGLSPSEIEARAMTKTAALKAAATKSAFVGDVAQVLGSAASGIGSAVGTVASKALPLMFIGPPVAGLGAGYALATLEDDNFDVKDAQRDEQLAEWNRAIQHLRSLSRRTADEEEGEE